MVVMADVLPALKQMARTLLENIGTLDVVYDHSSMTYVRQHGVTLINFRGALWVPLIAAWTLDLVKAGIKYTAVSNQLIGFVIQSQGAVDPDKPDSIPHVGSFDDLGDIVVKEILAEQEAAAEQAKEAAKKNDVLGSPITKPEPG
jgi:hypothetical protein